MADKRLNIKIRTDGAKKAKGALGGVDRSMKTLAKSAVVAAGSFYALKKAFDFTVELKNFARDAEETTNKFKTVFSSMESAATKTAKTLADSFGMAHSTAMELLGDTGDILVGFGFTEKSALELSKKVNELSVDLASFTNYAGGASGASQALTKAILGETESAKSLGIVLRQGTAEFKDSVAALQEAEGMTYNQAMATTLLNDAYKQSTKAIGDFARTQDDLANQERILSERFKELKEDLGTALLPTFLDLTSTAIDFVEVFKNYVKIPVSENLKEEQREFNNLIEVLKKSTTNQETRNTIIKDLQNNYSSYLTNIDLESSSIKQLADMQKIANTEFEKKIQLAASEEILQEAYKKTAKIQSKLTKAEIELVNRQNKKLDAYNAFSPAIDNTNAGLLGQTLIVEGLREKLEASKEEYSVLQSTLTNLGYTVDDVTGKIILHGDAADGAWKNLAPPGGSPEIDTAVFDEYIAKQQEMVDLKAQEAEWLDVIREMYPDLAEQMGLMTEEGNQQQTEWLEGMQETLGGIDSFVGAASDLYGNLFARKKQLLDNDMNAEIKAVETSSLSEESKQAKISNIKEKYRQKEIEAQRKLKPIKYAQAISGTASAVVGALGNKPWTPFNFALAGLVAGAGAAEIATIAAQPYALGGLVPGQGSGDTVPAMLTPGEFVLSKSAVQSIGVDTASRINSGQGGGITINISAPLVDETVVDSIIPAIEKAVRRNQSNILMS